MSRVSAVSGGCTSRHSGESSNAMIDRSVGTDTETGVLIIGALIGLLSSIVDNVPLVAAAMGMYPIAESGMFAQDGLFWEYLAFCAGTGGSILIIGSAAGVAVMGLEKIPFLWYFKNVSALALLSYFSGIAVYVVTQLVWGLGPH